MTKSAYGSNGTTGWTKESDFGFITSLQYESFLKGRINSEFNNFYDTYGEVIPTVSAFGKDSVEKRGKNIISTGFGNDSILMVDFELIVIGSDDPFEVEFYVPLVLSDGDILLTSAGNDYVSGYFTMDAGSEINTGSGRDLLEFTVTKFDYSNIGLGTYNASVGGTIDMGSDDDVLAFGSFGPYDTQPWSNQEFYLNVNYSIFPVPSYFSFEGDIQLGAGDDILFINGFVTGQGAMDGGSGVDKITVYTGDVLDYDSQVLGSYGSIIDPGLYEFGQLNQEALDHYFGDIALSGFEYLEVLPSPNWVSTL